MASSYATTSPSSVRVHVCVLQGDALGHAPAGWGGWVVHVIYWRGRGDAYVLLRTAEFSIVVWSILSLYLSLFVCSMCVYVPQLLRLLMFDRWGGVVGEWLGCSQQKYMNTHSWEKNVNCSESNWALIKW